VDRLWVYDVGTGTERLVGDPDSLAADTEELPAEERALRERLRLSAAGIGSYALDAASAIAVFSLAGPPLPGRPAHRRGGPGADVRPGGRSPAGPGRTADRVRHRRQALRDHARGRRRGCWPARRASPGGLAEFVAAEEFHRYRGYWWAPDGRTILAARVDEARVPRWQLHDPAAPNTAPTSVAYPHAGAPNAEVTLHVLDLDGGWVDVHWDRETYPYLVAVSWSDTGGR
jgi:dipeptidyl-peptidase-4